MLRILTYEQIDRKEWSRLVRESKTGTWFQSPEAYDFFASQPDLFEPFAVGVETSALRAVCVGYVTLDKNPLMQFFSRRAIITGGPCLADDATAEEVTMLMQSVGECVRCRVENHKHYTINITQKLSTPIYIETRNFNDYSPWKDAFAAAGFNYQPHLDIHIDTRSPEIVENNLGESRKRDIRTTIREGVKIISIGNCKLENGDCKLEIGDQERERMVGEFYAILKKLYKTKVKTPLFPLSFFLALSKHPDGRFLLTEYNGHIIGGTVCVEQAGKCLYEWFACGEDGIYPHIFPSCYATYAGICYAAEHDCPRFDMMGAGKPDKAYGVRDFKTKFGGTQVEYGRFLRVENPCLYSIGKLAVKILKSI